MQGAARGAALGELFEFGAEGIVHPQSPGELFGDVPETGPPRVEVHFLQHADIASQGAAERIRDRRKAEAALDVPANQPDMRRLFSVCIRASEIAGDRLIEARIEIADGFRAHCGSRSPAPEALSAAVTLIR